jgi:hypothetical protein
MDEENLLWQQLADLDARISALEQQLEARERVRERESLPLFGGEHLLR